jgi:hypothetical protein
MFARRRVSRRNQILFCEPVSQMSNKYFALKRRLGRRIEEDGYIPAPSSAEYRWPKWAEDALWDPNRSNRDRFKLFMFLYRNGVGQIDVIADYMLFWTRYFIEGCREPVKDKYHIESMIRTLKSQDATKMLGMLSADWWSLIGKKLMPGEKTVAEVQALIAGAPKERVEQQLDFTDYPTRLNGQEEEEPVTTTTTTQSNEQEELAFWTENDPEDVELSMAYDETMGKFAPKKKKLRRVAFTEDGPKILYKNPI